MDDAEPYEREGTINNTKIKLGKFTYGFSGVSIRNYDVLGAEITIGNFTSIGADTMMMIGGEHPYNNYSTYPFNHPRFQHELGGDGISWKGTSKGNISVGSDVWIGFGVTILSGVTIGDGAVIGAKTLVTKNVEPFSIIAGNPAKLIKYRFSESIRELMHRLSWWSLDNDSIKEISMNLFQSTPTEEVLRSLIAKFSR